MVQSFSMVILSSISRRSQNQQPATLSMQASTSSSQRHLSCLNIQHHLRKMCFLVCAGSNNWQGSLRMENIIIWVSCSFCWENGTIPVNYVCIDFLAVEGIIPIF